MAGRSGCWMGSSGRFYCSLTFLIITKGLLKQPFPSTSELCALWHLDFDTSSRIIHVDSCQVIAHLKCSTKCWSAWFTNSPQRASSADGAPWGRPFSARMQPTRFSELRLPILASPKAVSVPSLYLYSALSRFCSLSVSPNNVTNTTNILYGGCHRSGHGGNTKDPICLLVWPSHPLVKYMSNLFKKL